MPKDGNKWTLAPGDNVRRRSIHERFGGGHQQGIAPSAQTPNILVFTDQSGRKHGYFDRWGEDGCFHYTGEGQTGNQRMVGSNRVLLQHRELGKAVRLFTRQPNGLVRYEGEFAVAQDKPWYWEEAPETGNGPRRDVIVFRLQPVTPSGHSSTVDPIHFAALPRVTAVPVEQRLTETFEVRPPTEPVTAERREQELVISYRAFLEAKDLRVTRHRYDPAGGGASLFCDLFDESRGNLIEAKGIVTREAIRMAVGQLMDYRRFEPSAVRLGALLPSKPRPDLMVFLSSVGVAAIWPDPTCTFADSVSGLFV